MRSFIALTLAAVVSGCARQLYSAPTPTPAPVVLAGAPGAAVPRGNATSVDAVDYLLTRGMQIPVAGVSVSQLRDSFDDGRDGGRVHRALDIMAPRGTPVIAADSGRILRLGFNTLGGNCLYATDPLGRIVYYYAHLDAFQPGLAQGGTLARGDTIGFVGTTGNAPRDTPHLHFQVMRMAPDGRFWDGEPINPYPLFLVTQDGNR